MKKDLLFNIYHVLKYKYVNKKELARLVNCNIRTCSSYLNVLVTLGLVEKVPGDKGKFRSVFLVRKDLVLKLLGERKNE
jgi:predicted transcriptional regulator